MLGQILFGVVVIAIGLIGLRLPPSPIGKAWERVPERDKPIAQLPSFRSEAIPVLAIVVGIAMIVTAVV